MENANKFKVVRDITVLDCSTPYMFNKLRSTLAISTRDLELPMMQCSQSFGKM